MNNSVHVFCISSLHHASRRCSSRGGSSALSSPLYSVLWSLALPLLLICSTTRSVWGARWQLWAVHVCVYTPACMVSTRWVGGSAGREWERWERGRWNTEGSSSTTHRVSESREGRRGRGTEGAAGTAIGRGQACREGDGVDRVAGGRRKWKSQAEKMGRRGEQGRWEMQQAAGVGGRVTGMDRGGEE